VHGEARKTLIPDQRFFVGLHGLYLVTVMDLLVSAFALQCGNDGVCRAAAEGRGMTLVFTIALWILVDSVLLTARAIGAWGMRSAPEATASVLSGAHHCSGVPGRRSFRP